MTKTFAQMMNVTQKQSSLNPKFFNEDDSMKESVRDSIEERAVSFVNKLGYKGSDIEDIILVGGNASYDYDDASDLDVTILMDRDLNLDKKTIRLLGTTASNLTYRLSPSVDGTDLNFYISSRNVGGLRPAKQGIYSFSKGWVKKPTKQSELEPNFLASKANYFLELIEECAADERPEADDCADKLLSKLKKYRLSGLTSAKGEESTPNLVWRTLSRSGYIQMLKEKIERLEKDYFDIKTPSLIENHEFRRFIQVDLNEDILPRAVLGWSKRILKGENPVYILRRLKPICALFNQE